MPNFNAIALVVLAGSALAASIPASRTFAETAGSSVPQSDIKGGITVTGEGRATAAPDKVEIRISVGSSAKTTGNALQAYRAKRALFEKAMAEFEGVTLRGNGTRVGLKQASNQAFVFDGNPPADPKFEVSEVVTVPLGATDVQTVVEVIDEALDVDCKLEGGAGDQMQAFYIAQSGGRDPGATAIRYLASKEARLAAEHQAMQLAFADAKARAAAMAAAAGTSIVDVQSMSITKPFPTGSELAGDSEGTIRISVRFQFP